VVKYLERQNIPVSDLEEDVNIESDCEGDPQEAEQVTPEDGGETGDQTRVVLLTGSFSAYALLILPSN
jgi:hypothetical protein